MGLAKVRRSDGMWYCMGVPDPEPKRKRRDDEDIPDFAKLEAEREAALPF